VTLFIVDVGGAVYYVKAERPEECAALIEAADGYSIADECGLEEVDIREMTHAELSTKRITDEDGTRLGPGSLWWASEQVAGPHVVACSEWP
jgi:hypothetical protein